MDPTLFLSTLQLHRRDIIYQVDFKIICPYFVANGLYALDEVQDLLKVPRIQQMEDLYKRICEKIERENDTTFFSSLINSLKGKPEYEGLVMKLKLACTPNSDVKLLSLLIELDMEQYLGPMRGNVQQFKLYQLPILGIKFFRLLRLSKEYLNDNINIGVINFVGSTQAQELDYDTLLQTSKAEIKELIPKLGPRVKLWNKLEAIRQLNQINRRERIGAKRNRSGSLTM